jgi:hypothetical protein
MSHSNALDSKGSRSWLANRAKAKKHKQKQIALRQLLLTQTETTTPDLVVVMPDLVLAVPEPVAGTEIDRVAAVVAVAPEPAAEIEIDRVGHLRLILAEVLRIYPMLLAAATICQRSPTQSQM